MTAISIIEQDAVASAPARLVLTSRLGGEDYGIDILAVQEIRRYEPPTRILNAASHLRGVLDLRGVIVPIVDLRRLLRLPAETGNDTATVIVNVQGRTVGLVVDAVADVVTLDPAHILPRPALAGQPAVDFIVGLARLEARTGQRLLQLMDLTALLRDL